MRNRQSETGSCRPETMAATLQLIQKKYNGAEGYFKTHLNLNGEDIAKIRRNCLVNGKSRFDFRLGPIVLVSIMSIAVYLGFKYSRP
jgi:hypothetical protein